MINNKVGFYTLGCKVNSFDTDAMMELFEEAGYDVVPFEDEANVYVVNTCTITHLGDRKSRNILRRARKKNPGAIIVATGCYAQVSPNEVLAIPEVDLVYGNKDRKAIVNFVKDYSQGKEITTLVSDIRKQKEFEDLHINKTYGHTRAFLKVQEGCNQFCTFCIVPYARGPIRSRSSDSVFEEVKRLVLKGNLEMVLTGIHLSSYGIDVNGRSTLLDLISKVSSCSGLERIRLGSLEPRIITKEFLTGISQDEKFCPHFHLSLQSGSDTVLHRMGRQYSTKEYLQAVEMIREVFPLAAITTDVIVGFPGETQEEFEETFEFVQKVNFYQVHIFKYSKRDGTPAANFEDQVDEGTKTKRSHQLDRVVKAQEQAFLKAHDGQNQKVLVEQAIKDGQVVGHTANYIPVHLNGENSKLGEMVEVKLQFVDNATFMVGEIIEGVK